MAMTEAWTAAEAARDKGAPLFNKVPQITLAFWAIKLLSTTVGETGADGLAVHVGLGAGPTMLIMAGALAAALAAQMRASRYEPALYWLTVALVSIVGTQITDLLTDKLEISLYLSTAVFALGLGLIFAVWFAVERSLSIHSIVTRRREAFYWAAILCTFALGTAAGDLATEALSLGFRTGALVFAGLIAMVATAYGLLGLNAVLAFWLAYILTRPLGAALGDWLSQARDYGGLGWGAGLTSLIFLGVIMMLVGAAAWRAGRGRLLPIA